MSFSIRLSSDTVAVEAGTTTALSVEVTNRSVVTDRFELEIEGIDVEWRAVPVPVFPVNPEESSSQKIFFKPPRASESTAGNYPFVVRVRSLESGEARTVQGVVAIQPFHHLSMEISPKKGVVSPTNQSNSFVVSIVNLGNIEHTVRLQGNDPEDALAFEFEQELVPVGPGQQRDIAATVVPTSGSLVAKARLIGFTVNGRSVEFGSVGASAQAQLEQRSLFSPGSLIALILVLVIAGAWFLSRPKPPTFSQFQADPLQVEMGGNVTLTWNSPDATTVHFYIDGQFYTDQQRQGTFTFTTPAPGELKKDSITIEAVAERNGMRSDRQRATIRLMPPEVVAAPKIEMATIDHDRIKLGDPFVLTYKFSASVTKAVLSPDNKPLDPTVPSASFQPQVAGKTEYTIVAYNKLGKTVTKSFTVDVYEASDARILQFNASTTKVKPEEGKTVLSWSVLKAARVQLASDAGPISIDEGAMSGSIEVPIGKKTKFTLTAYDENGKPTSQEVVIDYVEPPKQPDGQPDPNTPTPPATTPVDTTGGHH